MLWSDIFTTMRALGSRTGVDFTIDYDDVIDSHLINQNSVGHRLKLRSMKVACGERVVGDTSIYKSSEVFDRKVENIYINIGTRLLKI